MVPTVKKKNPLGTQVLEERIDPPPPFKLEGWEGVVGSVLTHLSLGTQKTAWMDFEEENDPSRKK